MKYLEALVELLMINSLDTPSAWITIVLLIFVLLLGHLEIEANELAKSSVKLNFLSAVYAQDDSHK
jgi:hypothetical protein